jgi:hypothetical protein
MKIATLRIRLSLVCVFLVSLGCGSSKTSNTLDPTGFGNKYKFADNEMSGWKQDPAADPLWTGAGTDLHNKIDGGEATYLSKGCLLAMYQNLVGPDPQGCEVVAMDFGTADNATAMFTYQQQQTSASIQIPQFDATAAIAYPVMSGITVYAHIKATYFELQLIGYGSDQTSAAQMATQFLNVLKAKTN